MCLYFNPCEDDFPPEDNVHRSAVLIAGAQVIEIDRRPSLVRIAEETCKVFDITMDDLRGLSRRRSSAHPRFAFMRVAREKTRASLPTIGRFLSGRDHTTIMHGDRAAKRLMEENEEYRAKVQRVSRLSSTVFMGSDIHVPKTQKPRKRIACPPCIHPAPVKMVKPRRCLSCGDEFVPEGRYQFLCPTHSGRGHGLPDSYAV